ncbi:hypothetical protein C8R47DRAFT_1081898 [Mycena vitilis]|nr:hypothetical protein C8R47DRAFT_1081898 [Mycena vitilis]
MLTGDFSCVNSEPMHDYFPEIATKQKCATGTAETQKWCPSGIERRHKRGSLGHSSSCSDLYMNTTACPARNSNARPSSAEDVQSHRWTKQTPSEMPGRAVNAKWEGLIIATIYGRTLAVCGRMFTAVRAALTVYGRSRTAGHSGPYGTGQPRHLGSVSHHELTESASRVKKAKQRGRTRRGRGVTQAARAKGEQERVRRVGSRAVSSVANAVVSDAKPGMAPGAYVSAEAVA